MRRNEKDEKPKKVTAVRVRTSHAPRTEQNKARRAKQHERWLQKRTLRAAETYYLSMGASEYKNRRWRQRAILLYGPNGDMHLSVGLAKQRAGVRTAWKMPTGWSETAP